MSRKTPPLDLSTMVYGKVPPQAIEMEKYILGVLLLEPAKLYEARSILKAEDFYHNSHQIIYKAILAVDDAGGQPEMLSVAEYLRTSSEIDAVGGAYYLVNITKAVTNSANLFRNIHIIKQYSVARQLIIFSGGIMNDAYSNKDALQMLVDAEAQLFTIVKDIEEAKVTTLDQIAMNLTKRIFEISEEDENNLLYTGIKEWDRLNGMLFNSGVYVIAARPGMGKTAFAMEMIVNMASKFPIGFINVEMTDEQLAQRIISNQQNFDNSIYKKKPSSWTELEKQLFNQGLEQFLKLKLHIDSTTNNMEKIAQKIRFWVKHFGVRSVIIDYLQILGLGDERSKYKTETQIINEILEMIRNLSKELKIPIFLLCQLNRELFKRAGNKEPNLGDLKGSGKIEEVAFQISFLHRPEYYDKDAITDEMGESIKGLCYQIIAKHRDGELDRLKHRFIPWYSQFKDWESAIFNWKPPTDEMPKDLPF